MYDALIEYAKTLKGADAYYREDWDCIYFSLLGKCFGMLTPSRVTLKGDPHENMRLRDLYSDVTPGYYTNKIHWNSIDLNTKQLSLDQIKVLVDESYKLVFKKLKKAEKESLI